MNKKLMISALFITTSFAVAADRKLTSSGNDALIQAMEKLLDVHAEKMKNRFDSLDFGQKLLADRLARVEELQLAHVVIEAKRFIEKIEALELRRRVCSVEGDMKPLLVEYDTNLTPMIRAAKGCGFSPRNDLIEAWQHMKTRINEHADSNHSLTDRSYDLGYKPSLDRIDSFLEDLGVKKEASK